MPVSAATLSKLIDAGLAGDALVDVVASIDADMAVLSTPAIDEQAERRRAADRERARLRRQSADNPQTTADDKRRSPTPPKENTPSSSLRSEEAASTDARTILFNQGLSELSALTGKPSTKLRPILGKWLRDCDDDALRVLSLISKAKEARPAEPVAWIERHFRPNGTGPPRSMSAKLTTLCDQPVEKTYADWLGKPNDGSGAAAPPETALRAIRSG